MKSTFKTIALIGKMNNPEIREDLLALFLFLTQRGVAVKVERNTAEMCGMSDCEVLLLQDIGQHADLAIVLGGDGTMLMVARSLAAFGTPLIGVNKGRLGFLTDLTTETMIASIARILDGEFKQDTRMLLSVAIERKGQVLSKGLALNDVVVSKGASSRLIDLGLTIDGEFVHQQRSDGLILSTPTGTTAYALSAGGPLLHPTLEAIALVPICPHTLSNRPFAINSGSKVEITLMQADDARVHFDGQLHAELLCGDTVVVHRLQQSLTLLHPRDHSHYAMLRQKLHWG